MATGGSHLLGEGQGLLLQGPGAEGHAALGDGPAEQALAVGGQHLETTAGVT